MSWQAFAAHVARFIKIKSAVAFPDEKRPQTKDALTLKTVFDIEWLVQATDEIHEQRGSSNRVFIGICQLRQYKKVHVSIGMSATPILNNPRVRSLFNPPISSLNSTRSMLCRTSKILGACWEYRASPARRGDSLSDAITGSWRRRTEKLQQI